MTVRFCDPCPTPNEPHHHPEVDWIGDKPIIHGESQRTRVNGDPYCLCGHPNYRMCPERS